MINSQNKETLIRGIVDAEDKKEVKKYILEKHGDFFPNGQLFQKRKAHEIVYVNIFELSDSWLSYWTAEMRCHFCEKFITTKIESRNMGGYIRFCSDECESEHSKYVEITDDESHKYQKAYIYKITQISTNKCYIAKTVNHFIWRWWQHLKVNSTTKFHEFLRNADINDIKFEVLEVLSHYTDELVFQRETFWIIENDSIDNGFNTVIPSKAEALKLMQPN